jgi:hypothetical protein
MATSFVQIGAVANDGTGDSIRNAFDTVNSNFDLINGALFAGTQSSIISAASVTSGYFVSNSYILANTYVNANSIVGNTVTSNGNLYVSQDGAYIIGNVNIIGNLNVTGSQQATQAATSTAAITNLHVGIVADDGKDIGFSWEYYRGAVKKGFLGWKNTTGTLTYFDDITDTANVITGTYGNVQIGSLTISNSTATTSNTSGALQVAGGISTQGNLYVQGNVKATFANVSNLSVTGYHVGSLNFVGSDTIYINGSPVQTAAAAFSGGIVGGPTAYFDVTPSTSLGTGAVRVAGGFSANGNVYVGGNIVSTNTSVSIGFVGNVITASQPYITALGQLTSLNMDGQINAQNIVPELNNTYTLGSGNTTRWAKLWAYDIDSSGLITSAGMSASGNVTINTATNAGLTTTQTNAYLFNENAANVRIGGAGVVYFGSNTQATNTRTGAVIQIGGKSIRNGNLYIGGSGGNSIIATGNVNIDGDIMPFNGSGNIGSPTLSWDTVHAVATSAKYADLAERYTADSDYSAGTVVVFGGDKEITVTEQFADHRVAGVISTDPAYLMNSSINGLPVALRGRVPVKVINAVRKGDLLVTSHIAGYAMSVGGDISHGVKIFAKSLETNLFDGSKIIEAVIL